MLISVIIPVFNNTSGLISCLDCLSRQDIDSSSYEIIVVDNGSSDNLGQIVQKVPHAKLFHQARKGSYAARNLGLSKARGEFIAFTDSDCLPASDWLRQGLISLKDLVGPGMVAGQIVLSFGDPLKPKPVELLDYFCSFDQDYFLTKGRYGATANLFCHRMVFDQVGNFNENLFSGGDSEWGRRVFALGFKQDYCEQAAVTHPARSNFHDLVKKHRRLMGGLFSRQAGTLSRLSLLIKMSVIEPYLVLSIIKKMLSGQPPIPLKSGIQIFSLRLMLGLNRFTELIRLALGGKPVR